MINLNNSPSSGPLTAADLDHSAGNYEAPRIPRERHIGLGALIPLALVASIVSACFLLHWLLS